MLLMPGSQIRCGGGWTFQEAEGSSLLRMEHGIGGGLREACMAVTSL